MEMSHTLKVLVGFRKGRKITQEQLGESMKLSRMTVNSIENRRRGLTLDNIGAYLNSLNKLKEGNQSKITKKEWNLLVKAFMEDTLNRYIGTLNIIQ